MRFLGQRTIMNQLRLLLPEISGGNIGANILIRGPSGWGKTRLATLICNWLVGTDYQFSIADKSEFNANTRVHLVDEAHLIAEPEIYYSYMDSGKYVIVFTTNSVSPIPEALANRCYNFNLEPYSFEELVAMAKEDLWDVIPEDCWNELIIAGNSNPRVLLAIVKRINLYQKSVKKIESIDEFRVVLGEYVGIINGLDEASRRYLELLKRLGGLAGLDTMATLLHINKDALRLEIEPALLEKRLIKITSKGRSLL